MKNRQNDTEFSEDILIFVYHCIIGFLITCLFFYITFSSSEVSAAEFPMDVPFVPIGVMDPVGEGEPQVVFMGVYDSSDIYVTRDLPDVSYYDELLSFLGEITDPDFFVERWTMATAPGGMGTTVLGPYVGPPSSYGGTNFPYGGPDSRSGSCYIAPEFVEAESLNTVQCLQAIWVYYTVGSFEAYCIPSETTHDDVRTDFFDLRGLNPLVGYHIAPNVSTCTTDPEAVDDSDDTLDEITSPDAISEEIATLPLMAASYPSIGGFVETMMETNGAAGGLEVDYDGVTGQARELAVSHLITNPAIQTLADDLTTEFEVEGVLDGESSTEPPGTVIGDPDGPGVISDPEDPPTPLPTPPPSEPTADFCEANPEVFFCIEVPDGSGVGTGMVSREDFYFDVEISWAEQIALIILPDLPTAECPEPLELELPAMLGGTSVFFDFALLCYFLSTLLKPVLLVLSYVAGAAIIVRS